jgi:hypothetical protein
VALARELKIPGFKEQTYEASLKKWATLQYMELVARVEARRLNTGWSESKVILNLVKRGKPYEGFQSARLKNNSRLSRVAARPGPGAR